VTYGTTPLFLDQFGLDAVDDLPGLEELKGAGFLEGRVPPGLSVPVPSDDSTLREDEDPLDGDELYQPLPIDRDGAPDASADE
jgi:segregation and condensation protein B